MKLPSTPLRAVKKVLGLDGEIQHKTFEDAKNAAMVYRQLTELSTQA